jgi:hypothetical protein
VDEARTAGADQVVATDDDTTIANLPPLDAVGIRSTDEPPRS